MLGTLAGVLISGTERLEGAINPALALMLFVTFLQVPIASLRSAFRNGRFFAALLAVNFIAVPLLAAVLIQFAPADPLIRLGVLFVLLCPCIDYVVTFSHLGHADARLLLASSPVPLIMQMVLLPIWIALLLDVDTARFVQVGTFLHAFLWLIAAPLGAAVVCQFWAARSSVGARAYEALGLLPVPATAAVLFIVIAAVVPQLGPALTAVLGVAPLYAVFAIVAPLVGWIVAGLARLDAPATAAGAGGGGRNPARASGDRRSNAHRAGRLARLHPGDAAFRIGG
ncbi:arsenic resistance protein [Reyranella sp.]|uniref:arsenic resistance protein n=1 Tax=Reyranella sp. TaxID=1929291 RepID=UPI00403693E7